MSDPVQNPEIGHGKPDSSHQPALSRGYLKNAPENIMHPLHEQASREVRGEAIERNEEGKARGLKSNGQWSGMFVGIWTGCGETESSSWGVGNDHCPDIVGAADMAVS